MNSEIRLIQNTNRIERIDIPKGSSGLARSHRLIRIEREKEQLFFQICNQIKFKEYKETRSDNQREQRRLKR
jgi:hypothetical protein